MLRPAHVQERNVAHTRARLRKPKTPPALRLPSTAPAVRQCQRGRPTRSHSPSRVSSGYFFTGNWQQHGPTTPAPALIPIARRPERHWSGRLHKSPERPRLVTTSCRRSPAPATRPAVCHATPPSHCPNLCCSKTVQRFRPRAADGRQHGTGASSGGTGPTTVTFPPPSGSGTRAGPAGPPAAQPPAVRPARAASDFTSFPASAGANGGPAPSLPGGGGAWPWVLSGKPRHRLPRGCDLCRSNPARLPSSLSFCPSQRICRGPGGVPRHHPGLPVASAGPGPGVFVFTA